MILCLRRLGKRYNNLENKEVQMGMIAVLHTWGQQLSLHPHLHCIPGGGVDKEEQWKIVEVMVISISSKGFIESFRAKFCENSKQKSL
jgi:hypothetical protein